MDAPTHGEVGAAIGKLKNGRSSGRDGITAEVLKYSALTTAQLFVKLFPSVWRTADSPQNGGMESVAICKGKGARTECGSHRHITLLSVPGKVFAYVFAGELGIIAG